MISTLMSSLREKLLALRGEADAEMRGRWDRSLPFADSLFDRWGRAQELGFGEGSSIYDSACVYGNVSVGADTWIGPFVILDGSGGELKIGAFCDVSAGVHIYTHDTAIRCVSMGEVPAREGPVSIGDGSYIGPQSVVVAGVHIGSRCIVGANSFVHSDIPDRSVVAGSPAHNIGQVVGEGAHLRVERTTDQ